MENILANELVIKSIRYFETRRGLGYEAKTKYGSIWNDGMGGGTYFYHTKKEYSKYRGINEWDLEKIIDKFEGIETQDDTLTEHKIFIQTFDVPACPCCVAESEVE